jgi:hypothetical protein
MQCYSLHTVTQNDGLRALEPEKTTIGGAIGVIDDYDTIPNLNIILLLNPLLSYCIHYPH